MPASEELCSLIEEVIVDVRLTDVFVSSLSGFHVILRQ
jgi:hypothetical protein